MSKHSLLLSCVLLSAVVAGPVSSQAQSVCGNRAKFIETLSSKYEERPSAFGIAGQKNLVELFVAKSGSWTMLMTAPGGMTCIIATGQSWEAFPATAKMSAL